MNIKILTLCLIAFSCGIAQSQDESEQRIGDAFLPAPAEEETTATTAVSPAAAAKDKVTRMNNLRQIALAMLNFESAHMSLPARFSKAADGTRLLSWRVHILPFMDQNELYEKFKLDEPWNSPHNKKLITEIPDVYKAPGMEGERGRTSFVGIEHEESVLAPPKKPDSPIGKRLGKYKHGASNSISVIFTTAAEDAVTWTQPTDLIVDIKKPFDDLVKNDDKPLTCAVLDGSVHSFTKEKYEEDLNLTFFTTRKPEATTNTNADGFGDFQTQRTTTVARRQSENRASTNIFSTPAQVAQRQPSNWVPGSPNTRFDTQRGRTIVSEDVRGPSYRTRAIARPEYRRNGYATPTTNGYYDPTRERKIQTLQHEALSTDDEEAREKKLTLLKEQLEESFDKSIKVQATELEKLRARVEKLNTAFEKRKSNRDRVIKNYIDRVRLQAEGLTIPSGNSMFFSPRTYVQVGPDEIFSPAAAPPEVNLNPVQGPQLPSDPTIAPQPVNPPQFMPQPALNRQEGR